MPRTDRDDGTAAVPRMRRPASDVRRLVDPADRRGRLDIPPGACGDCAATHSLWHEVPMAGCGDLADTVGAALEHAATGAGHRRMAARTGLAATTVRGWLRRFRRHANSIAGRLFARVACADPAAVSTAGSSRLATAGIAVGTAAAAMTRLSGEPVPAWPYAVTVLGGRLLG